MRFLSCAAVQRRLEAYYDHELPVDEQYAVEYHLEGCPICHSNIGALTDVGTALRGLAASRPAPEELETLATSVVSRFTAENEQRFPVRLERMFEDMHLVWAGLGATAATLTCAVLLATFWDLSPAVRADSLAGIIGAMSAPGSDRNPVSFNDRILPPRFSSPDDPIAAMLAGRAVTEGDLVLALAAVVTQEGRVAYPELLSTSVHDREAVGRVLDALAAARLEPASLRGAPIAVNLVWLLTHTTVRAKAFS
ncbi:MAG: zf-HC2 domain-containing protein [Acidobacteria bacterium]|nr:zf-HC2 domain-containing protein [Acidobacteriota bacterium]